MKLTKGMKKALSLLLSAAMVVTGVNVTTNAANAADEVPSFTWTNTNTNSWDNESVDVKLVNGDGEYTAEFKTAKGATGLRNLGYVETNADSTLKITVKSVIVNGTEFETNKVIEITSDTKNGMANIWDGKSPKNVLYTNGDKDLYCSADEISYRENGEAKKIETLSYVFDVTNTGYTPVESTEPSKNPATETPAVTEPAKVTTTPAVTAEPTVEPTEAPTDPPAKPAPADLDKGHQAYLMFTDDNYGWGCWNENKGEDAVVTGNGTYTVSINKSYQRLNGQDLITTPKTEKSNRVITMPQFLIEEIKDYLKQLYDIGENDRMFLVTKSGLHREMDRGAKEAGVKRIRIHDIRHSHVSHLIDIGFSAPAIADRVGHESIDITYNYAHLFPSKQTEMADKLNMERRA